MTTDNLASTSENIMYNTMVKTYRDGSKQILCATKRVFREPGWESNLVYSLNQRTPREKLEAREREERRILWEIRQAREGKVLEGPDLPEDWEADAPWWDVDPAWWTEAQAARRDVRDRAMSWESLQRSMRRARVKVRDYCRAFTNFFHGLNAVDGALYAVAPFAQQGFQHEAVAVVVIHNQN